jgi:hypothetical protein
MHEVTEESFLADVSKHVVTVIRDDGVHRHLHCAIPGSGNMHFDVVTYPGYLVYSGDMGCYVFARIRDMFEFFRGKPDGPLKINKGYWGEKLEAIDRPDGYREFQPELLEKYVNDWLDENEADEDLREQVRDNVLSYSHDGEYAARDALTQFEYEGRRPFQDCWELSFSAYTFRFVWCCYALVWAIRQYDQARSALTVSEP